MNDRAMAAEVLQWNGQLRYEVARAAACVSKSTQRTRSSVVCARPNAQDLALFVYSLVAGFRLVDRMKVI
jgi:hypothetical protein